MRVYGIASWWWEGGCCFSTMQNLLIVGWLVILLRASSDQAGLTCAHRLMLLEEIVWAEVGREVT